MIGALLMASPVIAELVMRTALLWAPPAKISVSEWADEYRYLSPESASQGGKWTSYSYQREPMDAFSDPAIYRVVIKGATQMIKTVTIENAIAWAIDVDPGPIMVLQHRKEDAQNFVEERIDPMVRDTYRLQGKVWGRRKQKKMFRGGLMVINSAGSASNVASRAIRYLFCDEVDKYSRNVGDEGNPVSLARKRLATYKHRAKEIDTCSPTYEGSEIDRGYAQSDQREYFVACPLCGHEQSLMRRFYSQVRWNSDPIPDGVTGEMRQPTREEQARSARYHCVSCDQPWEERQRREAIERGRWIAQARFNGIAGFWISELYSVSRDLWQIVLDFLQKKDDPEELRTFVNTSLAENFAEQGDTPDWQQLANRREQYAKDVPKGALVLTAGADVHPDRIEVEIIGHGRQREKWSIRKEIFQGRTTEMTGQPGNPSPWEHLEAFLAEVYTHELGGDIGVTLLCIDSGNQSQDVYRWVRTQPPSRVVAIKGQDRGSLPVSTPSPVDVNVYGKKAKHGLAIRHVVGPFFKEQLYAGLKKQAPTPEQLAQGVKYPAGFCHFPEQINYSDEYFRQLCAEELRTVKDKRGRTRREWAQLRARNEVLDCWIYAMAGAYILGLERYQERHWQDLEYRLSSPLLPEFADASVPAAPAPKPAPQRSDEAPASPVRAVFDSRSVARRTGRVRFQMGV